MYNIKDLLLQIKNYVKVKGASLTYLSIFESYDGAEEEKWNLRPTT